MELYINISIIITLLLLVYQDIKQRAIHVILPIILLGLGLFKFFMYGNNYNELFTTSIFLSLVLIGLGLYVSVKHRAFVNPIDSSIGLGDIVFFIAIIPLFYSTTYVFFFISGMFLSVLGHLIFNKRKHLHVPLAGYLSIYLVLVISINTFTSQELLYTHFIL